MKNMERDFDTDKDGMIENGGFPDQTYDIWSALGVSAYCGGLWIASIHAMIAFTKALYPNNEDTIAYYETLAVKAKKIYREKLFHNGYLHYDSSHSDHSASIMTDMLCGQFYSVICDLPSILPDLEGDGCEDILSCLHITYRHNVVNFAENVSKSDQPAFLGAVNGIMLCNHDIDCSGMTREETLQYMLSQRSVVDNSCMQSREVWTGVTYTFAAHLLSYACNDKTHSNISIPHRRELLSMAINTMRGIAESGWDRFGYHFATPEAYEGNGNYRSLGYMRPLAIWAMQYVIDKHQG